jgi:hypothetical protein
MSKTHSQPLSKELVVAILLACGLVICFVLIGSMIIPGAIELIHPLTVTKGTDPIDRVTVNEAIKLIQE